MASPIFDFDMNLDETRKYVSSRPLGARVLFKTKGRETAYGFGVIIPADCPKTEEIFGMTDSVIDYVAKLRKYSDRSFGFSPGISSAGIRLEEKFTAASRKIVFAPIPLAREVQEPAEFFVSDVFREFALRGLVTLYAPPVARVNFVKAKRYSEGLTVSEYDSRRGVTAEIAHLTALEEVIGEPRLLKNGHDSGNSFYLVFPIPYDNLRIPTRKNDMELLLAAKSPLSDINGMERFYKLRGPGEASLPEKRAANIGQNGVRIITSKESNLIPKNRGLLLVPLPTVDGETSAQDFAHIYLQALRKMNFFEMVRKAETGDLSKWRGPNYNVSMVLDEESTDSAHALRVREEELVEKVRKNLLGNRDRANDDSARLRALNFS